MMWSIKPFDEVKAKLPLNSVDAQTKGQMIQQNQRTIFWRVKGKIIMVLCRVVDSPMWTHNSGG